MSALIIPIKNILAKGSKQSFHPNIIDAVNLAEKSILSTKRKTTSTQIVKDVEYYNNITEVSKILSPVNVYLWIKQITAGIIYYRLNNYYHIDWNNSIVWSPHWLKGNIPFSLKDVSEIITNNQDLELELEQGSSWYKGETSNPRPYTEQIYNYLFTVSQEGNLIIKHRFFSNYSWYIKLEISTDIRNRIVNALL